MLLDLSLNHKRSSLLDFIFTKMQYLSVVVAVATLLVSQGTAQLSSIDSDIEAKYCAFDEYNDNCNTIPKLESDKWALVYTTGLIFNGVSVGDSACVFLSASASSMSFAFHAGNSVSTEVFPVYEDTDGHILTQCGCSGAKTIFVENGVFCVYFYSTKSGVYGVSHGSIFVIESLWNDPCTRSTLKIAENLFRLLGITTTKQYGAECFPYVPPTTCGCSS